jgi:hypothetical protein
VLGIWIAAWRQHDRAAAGPTTRTVFAVSSHTTETRWPDGSARRIMPRLPAAALPPRRQELKIASVQ